MFESAEIFCSWCRQKIWLHEISEPPKLFKQGQLWWCGVGMNIGDEVYGKGELFSRPVLVYKKLTSTTFLGLPVTSQEKTGTWYVEFILNGTTQRALLNQARVFDARRLQERLGELTESDHRMVRDRFVEFYGS